MGYTDQDHLITDSTIDQRYLVFGVPPIKARSTQNAISFQEIRGSIPTDNRTSQQRCQNVAKNFVTWHQHRSNHNFEKVHGVPMASKLSFT